MIDPLDCAVELDALLFGELGFHAGDVVGKFGAIEFLDRGCDLGEYRETLVRHFGNAAEHDDLLTRRARDHRENAWPDPGNDRRMACQHAEIALGAGDVDLVDFAGKGELLRRDKIEVEGGHDKPCE